MACPPGTKPVNTCDMVKTVHAWKPEHKTAMRALAEFTLREYPVIATCFRRTSVSLATAGNAAGYDWRKLAEIEVLIAETSLRGDFTQAAWIMAENMTRMIAELMPDCTEPAYLELVTRLAERPRRISS